jgi:hypothetical protein
MRLKHFREVFRRKVGSHIEAEYGYVW